MPCFVRRLLFNVISAISMAACLATVALWVRSTDELDRFSFSTSVRRLTAHSKEGEIYLDVATAPGKIWQPGFQHIHSLPTQYAPPRPAWEFAGVSGGSDSITEDGDAIRRRYLKFPLWPIAVLTAILPVLWFDDRSRKAPVPGSKPSITNSAGDSPS